MNNSKLLQETWVNYKGQLLNFIRAKVDSPDDAEDILSLAFTKLMEQQVNAEMPKEVVPWLYRVIRNSIADYYRSARSFDYIPNDFVEETPSPDTFETLSGCVVPMINVLPEPFSQILKMSDINRMKNREIAEKLDLSLPAVKSRILRGRQKLHKKMALCCEIQRDTAGSVVDFEQKTTQCCKSCGD